jgi:hypothetical protein
MSYTLEFYQPGGNFSVGPTRERMITVELEPGYWDIAVRAWYGSALAALDKKVQVEIRAGRKNSVSFTMNADEFITPDMAGWPNQNQSIGVGDPWPSLTLTMNTSTPFSSIHGWTDNFLLGWYCEDEDGAITVVVGADGFFGTGEKIVTCLVDTSRAGTFSYYVEITNNYSYVPPGGGASSSGTAKKSIPVAQVTVSITHSVGDTGPGGGTIFYVDPAGFISGGNICHYLEAAPSDLPNVQWGASGTLIGGTGTAIGTGYTNTYTIITALSGLSETGRAAQSAVAYTGGGFTDWFLPSRGELQALYQSGITGLSSSVWSSTENGTSKAWSVGNTGSGVNSWNDPKTGTIPCRPIRAF